MMDARRAKIIEALIQHLEELDGGELKSQLAPKEAEVIVAVPEKKGLGLPEGDVPDGDKGPMEKLMAEKGEVGEEPEMDDDEFEEMVKLAH